MPIAVVDASVAVAWALPDERSESAVGLLNQYERGLVSLVAPSLWQYEIASALSRGVAQGRITAEEGNQSRERLRELGVECAEFGPLAARAWALALDRQLTIYDASYVALAEARSCELYTCDALLAKAAGAVVAVRLVGSAGTG